MPALAFQPAPIIIVDMSLETFVFVDTAVQKTCFHTLDNTFVVGAFIKEVFFGFVFISRFLPLGFHLWHREPH